jgi:demethylmenaquinone methyltransferase/2-methoxy-6-polyprenyl-1,4-benzoquinol methylase
MATEAELRSYYAKRAAEYERIYDKPERQADLARLKRELPELFAGCALLEIACGTGYWTPLLAGRAASVHATDANEEVLAIARAKPYPRGNVSFERCDAYALPAWQRKFDACFAGFWWSHVPGRLLPDFLDGLHRRLATGARVAFLDNRYVEGSSTPLARTDAEGNTYQLRRLADGSEHEVLKNFPDAAEIDRVLGARGREFAWRELDYYWYCTYRTAD